MIRRCVRPLAVSLAIAGCSRSKAEPVAAVESAQAPVRVLCGKVTWGGARPLDIRVSRPSCFGTGSEFVKDGALIVGSGDGLSAAVVCIRTAGGGYAGTPDAEFRGPTTLTLVSGKPLSLGVVASKDQGLEISSRAEGVEAHSHVHTDRLLVSAPSDHDWGLAVLLGSTVAVRFRECGVHEIRPEGTKTFLVLVAVDSPPRYCLTDADGRFAFNEVPLEPVELEVDHAWIYRSRAPVPQGATGEQLDVRVVVDGTKTSRLEILGRRSGRTSRRT